MTDKKTLPVLLLAEDDMDLAEVIGIGMERLFEVLHVISAGEAEALLESRADIQLVLTDWNLAGGSSGADVVESARAKNIPVVAAMTARVNNLEDIERCGPDEIFRKPEDLRKMRDRLMALLREAQKKE